MIVDVGKTYASTEPLQGIERELLDKTGGQSMAWVGRGATALYYAYQVVRALNATTAEAEVILPSIACASLANTANLAKVIPRFADVDPNTGMLSFESIKERTTRNTRAVVFIHLYGNTYDLDEIAGWCKARGILLIEDNAQALGGRLPKGSPVGTIGDMSIYSFNKSKIIDSGAGALLARTDPAVNAMDEVLRLYPLPQHLDGRKAMEMSREYRDLQRSLMKSYWDNPSGNVSESFMHICSKYDSLYMRPFEYASTLSSGWEALPGNLQRRCNRADEYAELLSGGPWRLLNGWPGSGVCWRCSLLLENHALVVPLGESLRQDGFHVSNLFLPLHVLFRPSDCCPNAEDFSSRIMNLWVDYTVDEDYVARCAESFKAHALTLSSIITLSDES